MKLEQLSQNAQAIFEDDFFIFDSNKFGEDGKINKESDLYKQLIQKHTPEIDEMTCLALEAILSSVLVILERQAKDQLDGGKNAKPFDDLKKNAEKLKLTIRPLNLVLVFLTNFLTLDGMTYGIPVYMV